MHFSASVPSDIVDFVKANLLAVVKLYLQNVQFGHVSDDFDLFPSEPTAKWFYVKYYRSLQPIKPFLCHIIKVIEDKLGQKLFRNFQDEKHLYYGLKDTRCQPNIPNGLKTGWTKFIPGKKFAFIRNDADGKDIYVHTPNLTHSELTLFEERTRVIYTEVEYNKRPQAKNIRELYTPLLAIPLYQTQGKEAVWDSHISVVNLEDKLHNGIPLKSVVKATSDPEMHTNILSREQDKIQYVPLGRNKQNKLVKYDSCTNKWSKEVREDKFLPFETLQLNKCILTCTCAKGLLPYQEDCSSE